MMIQDRKSLSAVPDQEAHPVSSKVTPSRQVAAKLSDSQTKKAAFREKLDSWIAADDEQPKLALIVDDDPKVASSLARLLCQDGIDADHAATPAKGLEMARRVAYDIVITDFHSDNDPKTGMDLIAGLRSSSLRPLVPVLAISGQVGPPSLQEVAKRAQANAWIGKPFDVHALQRLVAELLGTAAPEQQLAAAHE